MLAATQLGCLTLGRVAMTDKTVGLICGYICSVLLSRWRDMIEH